MHFCLHHTVHCAEKIVSAHLCTDSALAERVGQGKVGGVTRRVTCAWWLLGLVVKAGHGWDRVGPFLPWVLEQA